MPGKSLYTKKLGATVADLAQSGHRGHYHVIPREENLWSVVLSGSTRALRSFSSQKAAIAYAKLTASEKTGEVIIHGKTGQIRRTFSYAKK